MERGGAYISGFIRIGMGWMMLWAFLDKLFGMGFSTARNKSWLLGGSPTFGFLKSATKGPLASFYQSIAGSAVVDWIFMIGLLMIGICLILGIGMRIAGYSGIVMFLLMWSAVLPPANNPFLDDHIIYSLVLLFLIRYKAGRYLGLGKQWEATRIVRRFKILA